MERKQELESAIQEYVTNRTKTKREYLAAHYSEIEPGFYKKLSNLIDQWKKKKRDIKICYIYLNRLLTSSYTENYETILGIAGSDLYLDEYKSKVYWFPVLIYKHIDQDMRAVEALLRKKFTRLESFELFYLKKILLDEDWKLLQEIFVHMIEESMNLIVDSSLQLENKLQILSGDYMDKPEYLTCIPIKIIT